jgi:hypothetical protein
MRWGATLSATLVFACAKSVAPAEAPSAEPVAYVESVPNEPAANEQPAVETDFPPICDEYLDLYARCEQHLMPEIMAGNRRFHHAEEASLRYFATTPEAGGLPSACQSMLDALRADCPEQHRQPQP